MPLPLDLEPKRSSYACCYHQDACSSICCLGSLSVEILHFFDCLQVFYHLGELDDALTYALGAETLFDLNEKSEYVQTLLGEAQGKAVGENCFGGIPL